MHAIELTSASIWILNSRQTLGSRTRQAETKMANIGVLLYLALTSLSVPRITSQNYLYSSRLMETPFSLERPPKMRNRGKIGPAS